MSTSQGTLPFDQSSRLFYDRCSVTYRDHCNEGASQYSFAPRPSETSAHAGDLALGQPTVQLHPAKGSVGDQGCLVDVDSHLRNSSRLTHYGEIQQLHHETHFNVPYLANGPGNPCIESVLQTGEGIRQSKSGNIHAGVDVTPYRFQPLLQCIRDQQKTEHLVQEDNRKDWIRGGQSSRELLRNPDVLKRMGYRHNGKFWQKPSRSDPRSS